MKLFLAIQEYFAIIGVKPSQRCGLQSFVVLTILVHFSAAAAAFILYDAESFKDVADSFYASSASHSALLNVIVTICNSSKFFALIESYEDTIQSSKHKMFLHLRIVSEFRILMSIPWNCVSYQG